MYINFQVKVHEVKIPHIYNFWNNGNKVKS